MGSSFSGTFLMVFGMIPLLGSYIQLLTLKWLVRSVVLTPVGLTEKELKAIVDRRKAADAVESELRK